MSHILEFLDLVDVPDTYSGSGGYRLRVNSTPDEVEFVADTFTNLSDTPSDYSGFPDYYLKVNSGATAVEFQSAANLETALGGPFLPLTAGSGSPLTGNLHIETTVSPSIFLKDTDLVQEWQIGLSGTSGHFAVYNATVSSEYPFVVEAGGSGRNNQLICWSTGNVGLAVGNLYLDKTADPSIYLREAGSATSYLQLADTSSTLAAIYKYAATGSPTLRIDPVASDGTSAALIDLFRTTNTTGGANLRILQGDGTSTQSMRFEGDTGHAYLFTGNLYLDQATDPSIFLRTGGDINDYTRLFDDSTAWGKLYKYGNAAADSYLGIGTVPNTSYSGHVMVNYNAGACAETYFRVFGPSADEVFRITGTSGVKMYGGNFQGLRIDTGSSSNLRHYLGTASGYLGGANQAGALVIKPYGDASPTDNIFITCIVHGNEYHSSGGPFLYILSGYWQGGTSVWNGTNQCFAQRVYGNPSHLPSRFRLMKDASGYPCMVLGETTSDWDYATYSIDMYISYTGASNWDYTDLTVTLDASLTSFTTSVDIDPIEINISTHAAEISALTGVVPQTGDHILLEDNSDSDNKKQCTVQALHRFVDNSNYLSIEVSNDSGSAMAKGDLCYISGDSSGVPQVTLADADAAASASKMLVLIQDSIGNGSDGTAILFGVQNGFTSLTVGGICYVSTTAGDITQTAPSGSGDIVRIVGHAISTTEIFFNPSVDYAEV